MTCAELLIRLLQERYDVEKVFGIPGVHTVELYRGLEGSDLRHVTPRHEQGAGFMADGYARASGKPGVCLIITGPGMTNIATAMGQALADSIPMLVISSVNRRDTRGQGRLHELTSQQQVMAGVSRFSHTLLDPNALTDVLDRAFAVFASARPGPVHIEIPIDLFASIVEPPAKWQAPRLFAPAPDPEGLAMPLTGCVRPNVRLCCLAAAAQMPSRRPVSWSSISMLLPSPLSMPKGYWAAIIL